MLKGPGVPSVKEELGYMLSLKPAEQVECLQINPA